MRDSPRTDNLARKAARLGHYDMYQTFPAATTGSAGRTQKEAFSLVLCFVLTGLSLRVFPADDSS